MNINNTFSNVPHAPSNVGESASAGAQESKMEIQQEALGVSKNWKEFVLEYREYPRNLQEYQAQRLARENLMQTMQELPPPPPLPLSVPVSLSGDVETNILPEKFLLLFNKCEFMKRQIFSGMDQLEKDSLDLSEFEECHLEAAYKILEEGAITQETFELGGLGGIRLVEFLCPKEGTIFKIDPSLFISLQGGDVPEECQIHLPVSLNLEKAKVENLEALAYFPGMQALSLKRCSSLRDFSPIASLTNLRTLDLSQTAFADSSLLSNLHHLQKLSLASCPIQDLRALTKIENGQIVPRFMQLEELQLNGCSSLRDFSPIASLTSLHTLNLSQTAFADSSLLSNLHHLQKLQLNRCFSLRDFSPIASLTSLRTLSLSQTAFADSSLLSNLHHLQKLSLASCPIQDLRALTKIENGQIVPCLGELEELDIGYTNISDISILPLMPIRRLNLEGASEVVNYRLLSALQLDWISLEDSDIQDLSVLVNSAQSLRYLNLRNCEHLQGFTPLTRLPNVRVLNLSVTEIARVAILQNMDLQELYLYGCEEIEDIDRLSALTTLQRLDISRDTPTSLAFLLREVRGATTLSLPRLNHLVVKRQEGRREWQRIDQLRELGVTVEVLEQLL